MAGTACGRPTEPPPVDVTPGPDAPLPPGVAEALTAPTDIPAAAPVVTDIAFVLRPVATPPTDEPALGAGAWSPDGRRLIAFTREVGAVGAAVGRLWIVDAGAPSDAQTGDPPPVDSAPPRWAIDSGDVVGEPGRTALGAWRADGRVVLARSPDGLLDPAAAADHGEPAAAGASAAFPDLAPTSVVVAPDGATALLSDDQRGWLVDGRGAARPIDGYPAGLRAADWAWRADGASAAAVRADGAVWILDAAAAAARQMSLLTWAAESTATPAADGDAATERADSGDGSNAAPAAATADAARVAADEVTRSMHPMWLADGRILIPRPARLSLPGGPADDVPLVDPTTGALDGLGAFAELPPNLVAPPAGLSWATARGGWLLAPRIIAQAGAPALGPSRLVRLDGAERRDLQAIAAPNWAPDGSALAYVEAGALFAYDIASGGTRRLVGSGAQAAWWSPDGARLALAMAGGGLAVVTRDGSAGPTHIADGLDASLPPSWSNDGDRLAVVLADSAGRANLTIIDGLASATGR
ncbi:MAG: hypothetical protein ABI780_10625 [Ardenticatenales bacterium]